MANQLKKIKTRSYSISKVNFIRQALAGYGGGSAIASEMIQNADDAKADQITFHFTDQALIVRNNSVFTDKDFDSITEIAKGEKAPEAGKIGTWGTGFLSVFHITDAPELRSSGEHTVFDPGKNDLDVYNSDVIDSTEFRLPWRTKSTELSQRLEADIWPAERILGLKNNLINDIYRLVLFLRHVNIIEVYEGNTKQKLVARVERKPAEKYTNNKFIRLQREIEYRRGGPPRTDTWFYYEGHVPAISCPSGITIKDSGLAIAFSLKKSEALEQIAPAALYNFLPTPINTGLPFQINGAFFPDNNRQSILLDETTQREKSAWNKQVLQQLGQLFVDAVPDIREQVKDVRRFYELLPVIEPRRKFLAPVQTHFREKAGTLPIVFTTLNDWREPKDVFMGRRGSRLPELAADYLPVLPTGVPQEFRDFLEKDLKSPTLKIKNILDYLSPNLEPGVLLTSAHSMINHREKLEILYGEISGPVSENIPDLRDFIIGLAENQTLWPLSKIWRADGSTRRLLAGTGIQFVDDQMQQKFHNWLANLVDEFKGAELVNWLAQQEWPGIGSLKTNPIANVGDKIIKQISSSVSKLFQSGRTDSKETDHPLSISEAPRFIRSAGHLAEILQFIAQDLPRVNKNILSRLPLVRNEEDCLLSPGQLYRHDDPEERASFKKLGLHFVYPDWSKDVKIWAVYEQSGVNFLRPQHVIEVLQEDIASWGERSIDEVIEYTLALYQYFDKYADRLNNQDKVTLRKLPLCVTQKGQLIQATGNKVTPHLSSEQDSAIDKQIRPHLDKLALDILIHSRLIIQGRRFLTNILQLEPLSPARLIETVIVPNYRDPRLNDAARQDLLYYTSEQLRSMSTEQQRALLPKLSIEPLIHCADGEYYPGRLVYFASPALDTVFVNGYHKLHSDYKVDIAKSDDHDQTPYNRSTWYWLFGHLGVNETPTPIDLVKAVEAVVSEGPPTAKRLEAVRRIYELLSREAGRGEFTDKSEVKKLAYFAWLPARNDDAKWYKPAQLYQASHADFIGEQSPLLRFPESSAQLRGLLGMPAFPTVDIIANHLLACASKNDKVETRVYDEVGRRWGELSPLLKHRLKSESVVWGNSDKYWPTDCVFLSDYHRELFGRRRCYLKPPGGDAQEFLRQIGVKEKPDEWRDSVELLLEISGDYTDAQPVDEHDLRLLYSNFDHLGRQLPVKDGKSHDILRLAGHKLVPAKDGCLYSTNRIALEARQDILDQFDPNMIPIVPEDKLTENAYHFLRELGVQRLSLLIRRRPVDTSGSRKDDHFSLRLRELIPAFKRIALTRQEQNDTTTSMDLPEKRLHGIELRVCQKLVVGYELNNGDGWYVPGHSREEEALYFSDGEDLNYLYVKQTRPGKFSTIALSRELERILFPNSKESPVIEVLLQKQPAEVNGYLDEHGYRRLYQDEIADNNLETEQSELTAWDKVPETPPLDIAETGDDREDDMDTVVRQPEADESIPIESNGSLSTSQGKFNLDIPGGKVVASREKPAEGNEQLEALPDEPANPNLTADTGAENTDETLPLFTGIRRPAVPMLPNEYGELQRKFGLKRTINNGIGDSDTVEADNDWQDPSEPEPKDGVRQVRQTRFTLTFTNRYEGFLPLHYGARRMLHDRPAQLNCRTDYEEWVFPIYINYDENIIYNQTMLPKFFEAYNIPAGGIVYLERVSYDTVRLFWQSMSSPVDNIRCLELLEDGTLNEYEVPTAEFPCEISEYVLRAEKRLEDQAALFKQAIDKRGAFQTICEVFGESGKELTYDEIFKNVTARRQVAKATIDYQLNQRPCFVDLGNGRWCFEPERGTEPKRSARKTPKKTSDPMSADEPLSGSNGRHLTHIEEPDSDEIPVHQPASPYHLLLVDIQPEWQALDELFHPNGNELDYQLQQLSRGLITLGRRIQSDLSALAETHIEPDDTLAQLWKKVINDPKYEKDRQNLARYLMEQMTKNPELSVQLGRELALTSLPLRQQIFFPLLNQVAEKIAEAGEGTTARDLYVLLQQQGGGDFEPQLIRLKKLDEAQEYINLTEIAETLDERWQVWHEAWQKYPGSPIIRRAIQSDLSKIVPTINREISEKLRRQQADQAGQQYIMLFKNILPVWEAWQTDAKTIAWVCSLACQLFETFIKQAQCENGSVNDYQQALQIIKLIPLSMSLSISGDSYLEAVRIVADYLEEQPGAGGLIALTLLEYGLFWIERQRCVKADRYASSRVHENAAGFHENVGFVDRAYFHAQKAQRLATSGDRKKKLGQISYALNEKRDGTDKMAELENRRGQMTAILTNGSLTDFISAENCSEFITYLAKSGDNT